ncbi:hypothetical protein FB451DRAFT_1163630 [Mycena latifolia]|nr:hypothetical protein FB451DRAFT_1163630 [Mycena latifolia]
MYSPQMAQSANWIARKIKEAEVLNANAYQREIGNTEIARQVSAEALGVGVYKHIICGALITTRMANDRQGAKAAQDARPKSAKSNVAEREACTELKSWRVNRDWNRQRPAKETAQANNAKNAARKTRLEAA